MIFAAFTAKTAVFSRRMKFDGGVALCIYAFATPPCYRSRLFSTTGIRGMKDNRLLKNQKSSVFLSEKTGFFFATD